jgi:hypothetical protein
MSSATQPIGILGYLELVRVESEWNGAMYGRRGGKKNGVMALEKKGPKKPLQRLTKTSPLLTYSIMRT